MKGKSLPANHAERMERVRLALDGLSVGDAFGEQFFVTPETVGFLVAERRLPNPPWRYTDDTVMALGITEVLARHGGIDQDDLAQTFARNYREDPGRGYGVMAHEILADIGAGVSWRSVAPAVFGRAGSMGNGSAMRVAPVGAYFADDIDAVVAHARASAEVTHAHPEGQAGAIAVAVAAAFAWQTRHNSDEKRKAEFYDFVLDHTPEGETRTGITQARTVSGDVQTAAHRLGSGYRVTSPDTVPFCLWCAQRHLDNYEGTMWTTVAGLGDRDTTCAIVGGIVALSAGRASIPATWLAAREPLPVYNLI